MTYSVESKKKARRRLAAQGLERLAKSIYKDSCGAGDEEAALRAAAVDILLRIQDIKKQL